jgi:TRAP-type C4-dicarboxylate transport system substrate-binding protein
VMRSFGVDKVTKYLLFPGFYDVNNDIITNLDKWKKLPKHLQDFMTELGDSHARNMFAYNKETEKRELDSYKAEGMQFIELPKADGEKMVQMANDFVAKIAMEKAPNETGKIMEYFAKKP